VLSETAAFGNGAATEAARQIIPEGASDALDHAEGA
jgi:hypothetical protein